jgi:hypothetical protein
MELSFFYFQAYAKGYLKGAEVMKHFKKPGMQFLNSNIFGLKDNI